MEIFRAQYAEKLYEKDTIMEYYLNSIYFGRGCYGVKTAAEEYYGKELQSLTIAECASLIGITNNPSLYNPYSERVYEFRDQGETTGVERNLYRQKNILGQMKEQGFITEEEYEEAIAQEIVFKSGIAPEDKWEICDNVSCGYQGTVGTYNRSEAGAYYCPVCGSQNEMGNDASQEVYSWFVDTLLEDVARDMAAQNGIDYDSLDRLAKQLYNQKIQQGGYHIYSTLDMDVQNQIDKIYTNLDEIPTTSSKAQLQSGIVVIDNRTGDIVGLCGGVGDKIVHDDYNRAVDAKLQTGSAQKPVSVYAPAFESGAVSPATPIKDMPITYTGGNFPKNDNRRYNLWRNVYSGIVGSVNTISIGTLQKVGFEYAFTFAQEGLGLEHLVREYAMSNGTTKSDLGYSPLGMGALTVGASVREMSNAYATFANHGVWREARTYTKVYDSEGNLVLDNTQETRQVMGEKAINYLNYCLYNAANSGTGNAAVFAGMNIAGKTGTTSSNKDRWFCGYTPYYTAAVWCGFDKPEQIHLTGNGANPSCRLWKKVMQPLHQGLENRALYDGSNFSGYSICLDTGKLATEACEKDVRGGKHTAFSYCYREDIEGAACDQHVLVDYCVTGGGVATEYCRHFPDVEIKKMSLVKRNKAEIDELKRAKSCGLEAIHTLDNYIWYTDGNWHGFSGYAQPDVSAPYITCPTHTKDSWKDYQEEQKKEEEATAPTEP
jgi:penicillin-binding protein 1A